MAIRQELCFVAVCDVCGTTQTREEYTPHASTAQEVIDIVTEKWGAPRDGWTRTADGRLVCDTVDDAAHRAAHEEAGRTLSDCAASVCFGVSD